MKLAVTMEPPCSNVAPHVSDAGERSGQLRGEWNIEDRRTPTGDVLGWIIGGIITIQVWRAEGQPMISIGRQHFERDEYGDDLLRFVIVQIAMLKC